jgi:hypothetical protein
VAAPTMSAARDAWGGLACAAAGLVVALASYQVSPVEITERGGYAGWLAPVAPERAATAAWTALGQQWVRHGALGADAPAMVRAIGTYDNTWRTPWVLAPLMLQQQGRHAEADRMLIEAQARWPEDPWFPAALGVAALDRGALDDARAWLDQAREPSP